MLCVTICWTRGWPRSHHFGRVCKKRTPNPGRPNGKQAGLPKAWYVCHSLDDDESQQAFQLNPNQEKLDITVTIEGTPVKVCIDSVSTANTIDYGTYEAICAAKTVPLKPTNVKLCPCGEDNHCANSLCRIVFRTYQYSIKRI